MSVAYGESEVNLFEYMPICVNIINVTSKHQRFKSMCTFAANKERYKIFLCASNLKPLAVQ